MLERNGATRLCRSEPTESLRISAKFPRLASFVPLLAVPLVLASLGLAQQSKPSKKHAKPSTAPAAPVAAPVPFRPGEILEYRVLFSKYAVNAAKIETTVVEERNFFGHLTKEAFRVFMQFSFVLTLMEKFFGAGKPGDRRHCVNQ